MIKANQINYLHKNFHILEGVDVSLDYGEFLAIVGPNGAGKSSLLSVLANEIKQGKQEILFKDKSIADWEVRELSQHKSKFSQHNSNEIPLDVKDVVMMGRYPYFDSQPRQEDFEAMNKMMYETDVYHLKDREYNTLSGGEKQRVHLSRVMAQLENEIAHKVVFLDEPLNNLDIKHQYKALEIIKNFTKKANSAIVVLHDLNLAAQFADKILLMKSGKVSAYGTPQEVFTAETISQAYNFPCTICGHPITNNPMIIFG
ncbi:heme ABC transporter ATP-binding protein [Chryseobacterium vrystaatense]|uniref:Heme ABC transporter ATP-binding protein n=1 Tax=Chryseobacterium vrystaatense TaxID=307480 RepID=A0A1M5BA50_9FLAO|nr:heme ABC transporter ATP-binding protein [Chryseobacterium vrystaatense]KFF26281.1 heme ABC transporter ATP-binding protein [Chryseobacterium vrystaatense]SHF39441.1 iron complex transport system ATP-binding protein [Chryseobacterium vrystaatense]